jgi:predicted RNase H-like HicB family nuclease
MRSKCLPRLLILRFACAIFLCHGSPVSEIIFEVREDEIDGGFVATALGHAIATQGDTVEELREMVRDAVHCHFGDGDPGLMPKIIRLHFVRDEALAV